MPKYAIHIEKDNLALITFLNGGVEPLIEDESTYFICTIENNDSISPEIKGEDDLYYSDGTAKDRDLIWL